MATTSARRNWLVGGLIAGALIAVLSVLGYQWVRRAGAHLMDQARQSVREGQRVGRSITTEACVDTAFARHVASGGFSTQVTEEVFLEGCLRTAAPTGMCDTVPATGGISGIVKFSQWSIAQCRARGVTDGNCPRLFQAVMHYCDRSAHRTS